MMMMMTKKHFLFVFLTPEELWEISEVINNIRRTFVHESLEHYKTIVIIAFCWGAPSPLTSMIV